jgi:zinc protease
MFQLLYLNATSPRRDTTAYQSLRTRLAAVLENQSASPEAAFRDTLDVTIAQHHFRARPFTMKMLDEANLDRALAIYADRFGDASDFTFVIVGNFTVDSIKPLVLRYIGGLPSKQRNESWRDVGVRPPVGVVQRVVRKGVEPKSVTQLVFTGPFVYTNENRLAMTLMLDILEIRLRDVVREELERDVWRGGRWHDVARAASHVLDRNFVRRRPGATRFTYPRRVLADREAEDQGCDC